MRITKEIKCKICGCIFMGGNKEVYCKAKCSRIGSRINKEKSIIRARGFEFSEKMVEKRMKFLIKNMTSKYD